MFPKEHLQPYIWVTPSSFQEGICSDLVFSRVLCFFKQAPRVIITAWKVSVFGVILVRIFPHISMYSVRMRENVDQNNSKYGHFLRSVYLEGFELIRKPSCSNPLDELPFFYCKRVTAATHSFKLAAFLQNKNCSKEIS